MIQESRPNSREEKYTQSDRENRAHESASMEAKDAKRRKTCIRDQTDDVDRISNLLDDVLHKILLLLPIRTIAQISILSRRWNSLWYSLPDLDFTTIDSMNIRKAIKIIKRILSLRDRNVGLRTLRLCAPVKRFTCESQLTRLIVSHRVQELDLKVRTSDNFNFPLCVLANLPLRVLNFKSSSGRFRLPHSSALQGCFASLTSLSLSFLKSSDQPRLLDSFTDPNFPSLKKLHLKNCLGMKQLRVSCKLLEEFNLMHCFQLNELEVASTKLKRLSVSRCFNRHFSKNWVKMDTPELESLYWHTNANTVANRLPIDLISLKQVCIGVSLADKDVDSLKVETLFSLLYGVSHARTLTLQQNSFEILSSEIALKRPLQFFHNVESLELRADLTSSNIQGLLRLLKSCPMLHKFILMNELSYRGLVKELWDMPWSELEHCCSELEHVKKICMEDEDSFLNHLKVVEIHGFLELKSEVILVIFLLKSGKTLTDMTLLSNKYYPDSPERQMIRSQIVRISSAYSNIKFSFK